MRSQEQHKSPLYIIGNSLFKDRSIGLNFDANIMTISSIPLKNGNRFEWLPGGQILIEIKLNNKPFKAVFDTGADLTVVNIDLINKYPDSFKKLNLVSDVKDASNKAVDLGLLSIQKNTLAVDDFYTHDKHIFSMPFTDAIRAAWGKETEVILGYNHIIERNWFFDFKNKTWRSELRKK